MKNTRWIFFSNEDDIKSIRETLILEILYFLFLVYLETGSVTLPSNTSIWCYCSHLKTVSDVTFASIIWNCKKSKSNSIFWCLDIFFSPLYKRKQQSSNTAPFNRRLSVLDIAVAALLYGMSRPEHNSSIQHLIIPVVMVVLLGCTQKWRTPLDIPPSELSRLGGKVANFTPFPPFDSYLERIENNSA